ncbi:mRNA-capping enzyme-like protein isoform X2 [Tanacetum coccineum]
MVRAKASRLWLTTPLNSGAIPNLVPNSIFLTFFSMARAYGTTTPSALMADFMSDFVGEIENNREVGFIKVPVRHHLADRIFSWVFRKLDVCLVGVEDGDGEVLYELGDRINRWLKDAQLTGYTGSYRDLLGEDEIVGITLSKQVFEDAALAVIRNKGEPLKWKRSFGITSLMISEPARFVL